MNLHALRIFNEVAKCSSITKAAQNLMISQPAVSVQIKNLEAELEVRLIIPKGRSIELTENGLRVYSQSKRLFSLEADIENELHLYKTGIMGRLRISATNLPSMVLLPNWIVEFSKIHNAVNMEIKKGNTRQTLDRLLNYESDLAVITGGWEEVGVKRTLLFEDQLCFVILSTHPLARQRIKLKDLVIYPFVFREEGSSTQKRLWSLCASQSIDFPKSTIKVDGLFESIQAVKAGYGIMLVPYMAVKDEISKGELSLVEIEDVDMKLPIWFCMRDNEDILPVTSQFILFLNETIFRQKAPDVNIDLFTK